MQLASASDARAAVAVQRCLLMGVLAVAQYLLARHAEIEDRRCQVVGDACRSVPGPQGAERSGNRPVVTGRGFECLLGELPVGLLGQRSGRAELRADSRVVGRVGDHRNVAEVLRGGPNQRGATDIDVLDQLVESRAFLGGCRFKRVEIDHDHVDGLDLVRPQGLHVLGIRSHRQNAARDARMEGLDASVQHLGKAGHVRNVTDLEAGFAEHPGSAARGDQLHSEVGKLTAEFDHAVLVGNAEKGPPDRRHKRPL